MYPIYPVSCNDDIDVNIIMMIMDEFINIVKNGYQKCALARNRNYSLSDAGQRGPEDIYICLWEGLYWPFHYYVFSCELVKFAPPHSIRAAHSTFQKQDEKEIHRLNGHRIIDYTSVHIYIISSSKGIRLFSSIA